MVKVLVSKRDSLDKALRLFEAKCRKAQVFKILREKSHFISKSEQRHRKRSRRNRAHSVL
jgi:ribosomal protein S21